MFDGFKLTEQFVFVFKVILFGTVNVGGVLSSTVIVLETDAKVLPQLSVAVHVSVTFPLQ